MKLILDIIISINGAFIIEPDGDTIKYFKKKLTIHVKNAIGLFSSFTNYKMQKIIYNNNTINTLKIPRFSLDYFSDKFSFNVINLIKEPNTIEFNYSGVLKDNQPIIIDTIMKHYYNEENAINAQCGAILFLEAGQGKTFVAMKLIEILKCKTLIVVHNTSILNQWEKLLKNLFTNNTIGKYYGKEKYDGDIVLTIINSAVMKRIYRKDPMIFFQKFGFVIFDEAHEYSSVERKEVFNRCNSKYILGLTASPFREDKKHFITIWNIGSILKADELDDYVQSDANFTGIVTKVNYCGHDNYTEVIINPITGLVSYPLMVNQICNDAFRIKLIVNEAMELHNEYKQDVFIFADRRFYLEQIAKQIKLNVVFLTNDKELSVLMGGSNDEAMDHAEKNAVIILTTYQFLGTGKSIPRMTSIILATPRKAKIEQYIGRILRLGSDYSITRRIIDIVDYKTSLKTQFSVRKKYYVNKNFTINTKKVMWHDLISS